jgi:hypothetical protein
MKPAVSAMMNRTVLGRKQHLHTAGGYHHLLGGTTTCTRQRCPDRECSMSELEHGAATRTTVTTIGG